MSMPPLQVSVIVPTYNRPDLLERCLVALVQQTLPASAYEIIVCDDGPSQAARTVITSLMALRDQLPVIRYLEVRETQGPAGARNMGWRASSAPMLAFTDDDTVPDPEWLRQGLMAIMVAGDAVTGRLVMPLPSKFTDYERDAALLQDAEFVTANLFIRRHALEMVGGFDERYTSAWREDSDLHFSLLQAGCTITHAPSALVVHPMRTVGFAAGVKAQRKVMYDVLLYGRFPALYRARIRAHPPWFYLGVVVLLALAGLAWLAAWSQLALILFAAWALLTVGFFIMRLRDSSLTLRNVAELLITSVLIPPLSIFWRVVGAAKFGWRFP